MRTRSRNIVHTRDVFLGATENYVVHKCDGSTVSASQVLAPHDVFTSAVFERIDDEVGVGQSHAVCHRRMAYSFNEDRSPRILPHTGSPDQGVIYNGLGARRPNTINNITSEWRNWDPSIGGYGYFSQLPNRWSDVSASINETSLRNDVWEAAQQLKADVLLNMVEANQMWPSVKSLATCLPQLRSNWGRIRKVVRTASGSYLAWKFGVSPVLSDAMAIHKYMPKLASDLDAHRRSDSRRFSRLALVGMTYDNEWIDRQTFGSYVVARTTHQGRIIRPSVIRYVLVVKPVIKYQTELFSALDGAMRRFATSPAQLAWEKVPFSFVADWFVDLRGALNAVDKSIGSEPFKVISFTRSRSYEVAADIRNVYYSPCNGSIIEDMPVATIQYKHYERSLASMQASLVWRPRFGKNQAGISAALIAQSLSKLRR